MDRACNLFRALEPLFPPGYVLDGDQQRRLLSLLAPEPSGRPQLVAQVYLTPSEWYVLTTLVEAYPGYVSYARLLALLTPYSPQECQQRLREAKANGNDAMKRELRPLRDALSSMHPKLRALSLMVTSVQRLGYLLAALEEEP